MDYYTNFSANSASSSSSDDYRLLERTTKPAPAYRSSLHSVRKSVITKKPIAPMPPVPPKIYKVNPVDFRDVVQRLTAAPEFQLRRLQEVAPPPLSLSPPPAPGKFSFDMNSGAPSPLGFSLSPASLSWCSSFIFSPRTLSPMEPSKVV